MSLLALMPHSPQPLMVFALWSLLIGGLFCRGAWSPILRDALPIRPCWPRLFQYSCRSFLLDLPCAIAKSVEPLPAGLTRATQPAESSLQPIRPPALSCDERPLRILLTDDSADNRMLIKAFCKRLPYAIDEAENGEVALNLFMAHPYDVVLMDLQMPVMDGLTAMRAMRDHEASDNLPRTRIIALTAAALGEDIVRSFEAGADIHVSKPVSRAALLQAVRA